MKIDLRGFTLAEVLITLTILGVVAAITLPTFMENMVERKNSEREANIAQKITQAMEHMRATGKLVHYESTEDFVNELKNHIKITKICDKDHLTDCWPTETVTGTDGKEYNISDAKTGLNMGLTTFTNNIGLILADGSQLILNYDTDSQGLDVGDRVSSSNKVLPVGKGKTKSFPYTTSVTNAIDYVTDVNGSAGPNSESRKVNLFVGTAVVGSKAIRYDVRSFKNASFSGYANIENGSEGKIIYIGKSYNSVNCNTSSSNYAGDAICGPHPSGYEDDYWAGAKAKCNKIKGYQVPTAQKLQDIYDVKAEYPSIASDVWGVFTSEEYSTVPNSYVWGVNLLSGVAYTNYIKYGQSELLCVGN